jgi:hypothetical protein
MGIGSATLGTLATIGTGQTNLEQTNAIVWVILGISVAGAIVTYAFLVYAVWKWRDPEASRRRYG